MVSFRFVLSFVPTPVDEYGYYLACTLWHKILEKEVLHANKTREDSDETCKSENPKNIFHVRYLCKCLK